MERDDLPNPYEAPTHAPDAESRWSVRIVGTPPGQEPKPIRQAWVGLALPLSRRFPGRREFRVVGVRTWPRGRLGAWLALLTGRTWPVNGYAVEVRDAVEALAEHAAHAAEWWRSNASHLLKRGRVLVFAADVCELILPPGGHPSVTFRDRLTEDDLVNIQWCLDRPAVRRSIRWLACGVATLLAALCLAALVAVLVESRRRASAVPSPIFVWFLVVWFVWVYLLFLLPRGRARMARRRYRRQAEKFLEAQVALSEERVTIENEAMRSELRWDLVGPIVDVPAGLLFCNSARQMLFWLPDRVLENDRSRECVLALARDRGVVVLTRI